MKTRFLIPFLLFSYALLGQESDSLLLSISVNEMDFEDFIDLIEKESQQEVIYKKDLFTEKKVTITANEKPLISVIKKAVDSYDYDVVKWSNYILIIEGDEFNEALPNYSKSYESEIDLTAQNRNYLKGRKADQINIIIGQKKYLRPGKKVKVTGKVVDVITGKAIENATLYIKELQTGSISNDNGEFDLLLKNGKYSIQVDCLGMKRYNCQFEVLSAGSFQISMEAQKFEIQEIQIYGDVQMNIRKKEAGLEKLNVEAIKELPTMMGESDIVKVSEMLPGVVSVGEGSAGINVRGGNFDQNAFYFNKISIYNTSHMFGFFPAFNADVIKDFTLYKGFIPAKYGGRLSSIFNIEARRGNKQNYTAHGGLSPIAANITFEGPIKRDTASFLVNFRTSYSDWILRQINDYNIQNSASSFYDFTASFDYDLPKTQINLFGYHSQDYFKFSDLTTYRYSNSGLSSSFGHLFSSSFRGDFALSASQYQFSTIDQQIQNANLEYPFSIRQFELSAGFSKEFSRKNMLEFGVNANWYELDRGKVEPYGDQSTVKELLLGKEQGLEAAVYIDDSYSITPLLKVSGGFRFSMFSSFGPKKVYRYYDNGPRDSRNISDSSFYNSGQAIKWYYFPEFRASLNYQTDENGSIKVAFNQMHQSMFMLNNTIALSPNSPWKLADYYLKPSRANQFSIGAFRTIPRGKWEVSLEVFYKLANDYTEFKDGANFLSTPLVETIALQGELRSYGVELLVKKSWPKIDLMLAYTYSRSFVKIDGEEEWDKINDGEVFPSNFDIPNVVNAVLMYRLSKRVSFSTNLTYQTGKPATFPTSFYYIDGIAHIDYSKRNEYRIPDYFRTDISLTLEGNLKKEKFLHSTFNFSVYNLTGRKNPYSVYFEEANGKIQGYQYSVIGVPVFMVTWLFKLGNYEAK